MAARDNTDAEIQVLRETSAKQIAILREANARLTAERDEAQGTLAAMRDPFRRAWPPGFAKPTDDELVALLKAVQISFPRFRQQTEADQRNWFPYFKSAFIALAHMPRHPEGKLNTSIDNTTWQERAQKVLRDINIRPDDFGMFPLMAAVLAHGDIGHTYTADRFPYDLLFAFGNHVGRYPDGSGWRRVLDTRTFRAPLPFMPDKGSTNYPVPQFRVTGGGGPAGIGGSI